MSSGNEHDGIGGTDGNGEPRDPEAKVIHLFPDRGGDGRQAIVEVLERLAQEAATGLVTGIAVVAFLGPDQFKSGTAGKMRYTNVLGGLEDLKYQILRQGPVYETKVRK